KKLPSCIFCCRACAHVRLLMRRCATCRQLFPRDRDNDCKSLLDELDRGNMIKLAANLSWLYQDIPFLDRLDAAAAHGFKAVEFMSPYEFPAEEIASRLKRHGLTQALFNLPAGDWANGERGLAALPGREAAFEQ